MSPYVSHGKESTMPRRPSPWFKASHNAWYVKVAGKTIRLAEDEATAWKEFHRLMASREADRPPVRPGTGRVKLEALFDAWLYARRGEIKESTFRISERFAQSLVDFAPKGVKASDVDARLVRAWLDANPQWKRSTPSIAVRNVKAALQWGVDEDWIPKNPLNRMKSPQAETRKEADPEVVKLVLDEVSENARHVLLFMYWTGARPGEAMSVEASGVDLKHGTARVVGKRGERTVVIASSFMPTIRRLVKARPTGPLFVNEAGTRWKLNALNMQILRAKERLGIAGDFVPYHLRGIFASERIAAGADLSTVGKLLGHSGIATLHKHYHKPALTTLREAVDIASPERAKKPRRKPGPKKR